jgi:hypothetical protein
MRQSAETTALLFELGEGPDGGDPSPFDVDDLVAVAHRRQPVGDEDDGVVASEAL